MDQLFWRFVRGLFVIMILFGVGMFCVIAFGETAIGLRMVSAFASMFVGVLSLGSGYILGRTNREPKEKGKEDP